MDIFGYQVSASHLPSLADVKGAIDRGVVNVESFGHAAVARASDLGRNGVDLGRRAITDPAGTAQAAVAATERTVHHVADTVRAEVHTGQVWADHQVHAGAQTLRSHITGSGPVSRVARVAVSGAEHQVREAIAHPEERFRAAAAGARDLIHEGADGAQHGIHEGVMWTGHRIHEVANIARDAVPGDNVVSRAVRDQITQTEDRVRFSVGAVGGVANEVVGLAGSFGELGVTATEMQWSPTARVELRQKIVGLAQEGGVAVRDYAGKVAADPTRLLTDPGNLEIAAGKAAWGFVEGQYNEVRTAAAKGQGPETLGFKTGQVANYFIPVGGGPARGLLTAGAEATARVGLETTVRVTTESAARGTTEVLARGGA